MPVLADVRVMPQHLDDTWQLLRDAWGQRRSHARMTLDPRSSRPTTSAASCPDELDADGAYRIARAYVDEFEPHAHRRSAATCG